MSSVSRGSAAAQRVLLLIPSASYRAQDFMEAAARLEIDVVVGCERAQTLASLVPGRTLTVNMARPEVGVGQIAAFARAYPLDAIVAVDDGGTRLAALASANLGLPYNPRDAVDATRDKHLMRLRLASAGVRSPWFALMALHSTCEPQGAELRRRDIPYPCVVKPLSLSASRGVIRADGPQQFSEALARIAAILEHETEDPACAGSSDNVLVEAYVPGTEVAVEGLLTAGCLHVLAVFDKPDPLEGPYFEETIYVTPSRLPAAVQAQLRETVQSAAAALGLCDGPVHAELRVNDEGVWPIEIAARSIGGLCSRTLSFGTGMSLEELLLRHATGAAIPSFERETQAAGVMMIPIPARGVLRAVDGAAEARSVPGIVSVTLGIRPGQPVIPLPEGGEYLGFIFARASEPALVEDALRRAHSTLRFDIKPATILPNTLPSFGVQSTCSA